MKNRFSKFSLAELDTLAAGLSWLKSEVNQLPDNFHDLEDEVDRAKDGET